MTASPEGEQERQAQLDTPQLIQEALARGEMNWDLLLETSILSWLGDSHEIGQRHLAEASEIYGDSCGGEVGLFPPIGAVCIHKDGDFEWSFYQDRIRFDWSEVWPLTYQIENLAEEAREWWPDLETDDEVPLRRWQVGRRIVRFLKRNFVRVDRPADTRRPHSRRAFSLATWILAAMGMENDRHPETDTDTPPVPTSAFHTDMALYRSELEAAQKRFRAAAQRTAHIRYWQGAIVGTAVIAALCLAGALVFWWRGTDAAYGIALPAGSLGAIVSVLQRMSSGKLVFDIDASRDLLEVFGAVRPFIGAIFGLAVTALLVGGLIPAIQVPTGQELAFFAGIGFLAGFNERWAQDILQSSSSQMGAPAVEGSTVETSPGPSAQASAR